MTSPTHWHLEAVDISSKGRKHTSVVPGEPFEHSHTLGGRRHDHGIRPWHLSSLTERGPIDTLGWARTKRGVLTHPFPR